MKPLVIICQYCGKQARKTTGEEVYGKGHQHIVMYVCRDYPWCDSYGSQHSKALANAPLRRARKAAHEAFDPLWQSGQYPRRKLYGMLARYMRLRREDTHIGHFDEEQCKKVIEFVHSQVIPTRD